MGRYINYRTSLALLTLLAGFGCFTLLYRSCSPRETCVASLLPSVAGPGEEVHFADSTRGAHTWLWEFGDGDSSKLPAGSHAYREAGRYQVRLTVNGRMERLFIVNVREGGEKADGHLVRIKAPASAMQGEYIVFKGVGDDKDWRWEFGESGRVDSHEKQALYAYSQPGIHEVLLSTENTRYPIRHTIEILPVYTESDSTDVLTLIGRDIREKLQNIADGKSFNANYGYVLREYLDGNPDALVTVNNTKYNDFYSYCQGLRHTGRNTLIETVIVETENEQSTYISGMAVIQEERKR